MDTKADQPRYGFSDEQLATLPTVFRADLFADQAIVVTGAGSGLGRAIACLFARLGADLAMCGRDEAKLARAAPFFENLGARVHSRAITIRDPHQVDSFIRSTRDAFGRVDAVINNAGGQFAQLSLDFKVKGWNAVIDTNLNGSWYMMQAAARAWVERGAPGSIVNIVADIWRGMPGMAHSCAARAGVIYASKSVAVEWAPHRIRVNCIAPGCCETSAFGQYPPEGAATYKEANPMRHHGDAWDIAEACAYLVAPSAKFITGEVLTVDGGQQLWGDPWPTGRPEYFRLGS
jgi:citronellol/citronellal dehydrogenase